MPVQSVDVSYVETHIQVHITSKNTNVRKVQASKRYETQI